MEGSGSIEAIFFSAFGLAILIGLPVLCFKLVAAFRRYRLSKLAVKYGLGFAEKRPNAESIEKRFFSFWLFDFNPKEKNILSGNIGNHLVEIYDWQIATGGWYGATRRVTVARIDGIQKEIDALATVGQINDMLSDLRDKDQIFVRNLWVRKLVVVALVWLIAITCIVLAIKQLPK